MVPSASGRKGALATALPTTARLTRRASHGVALTNRQSGRPPVSSASSILLRNPSRLVSRPLF